MGVMLNLYRQRRMGELCRSMVTEGVGVSGFALFPQEDVRYTADLIAEALMSHLRLMGDTEPHAIPRVAACHADFVIPYDFRPLRLTLVPSGMTLLLTCPETVVGRHHGCDVRLPLPDVSRRHCRLIFQSGRWWLLDQHSLNGVFVNDKKVIARALKPGDRLRVGGFTFLVDQTAASDERSECERSVLRSIAAALEDAPVLHQRAS